MGHIEAMNDQIGKCDLQLEITYFLVSPGLQMGSQVSVTRIQTKERIDNLSPALKFKSECLIEQD
jgi:hypothetical protein